MSLTYSHALALVVATDELVRLVPNIDTARLGKALRLAAENKVQYRAALGCYAYHSPRCPDHPYVIDIRPALRTNDFSKAHCTCPDHAEREQVCKHIMASWLVNRVQEIISAALQLQTISGLDTVDRYVQWALG